MATRSRRPSASTGTPRYPRTARLSVSLREVIAEELVRIDDEALEFVTITTIDVDPEMNRAIVYFDSLAGESGDETIVAAFATHRVRLQKSVARQIRSKKTWARLSSSSTSMPVIVTSARRSSSMRTSSSAMISRSVSPTRADRGYR